MSVWMRLSAIVAASIFLAACTVTAAPPKPTLVEVWRGGDDGSTLGLAYELEHQFRASPDFILSNGKKPGTLVVTIPTNLTWKRKFGRTTVFYVIEFMSADGQNLGTIKGSCSKTAFAKCAAQIVTLARVATGKMR